MTYTELKDAIETTDGSNSSICKLINKISEASVDGLITDEENDKLIEAIKVKF